MSETESLGTRSFIAERNILIVLGAVLLYLAVLSGNTMHDWATADNQFHPLIERSVTVCAFFCIMWGGANLWRAVRIQRYDPGKEESLWRAAVSVWSVGILWGLFATPLNAYGESISFLLAIGRDFSLFFLGLAIGVFIVTVVLDSARKIG